MQQLKHHQIDFIFPPNLKSPISAWLTQVKSFAASLNAEAQSRRQTSSLGSHVETLPNELLVVAGQSLDDVLETSAVQFTVYLISLLGHYVTPVRTKSAVFLFQLACILDDKLTGQETKLNSIMSGLQLEQSGKFYRVTLINPKPWHSHVRLLQPCSRLISTLG